MSSGCVSDADGYISAMAGVEDQVSRIGNDQSGFLDYFFRDVHPRLEV